MSLAGIMNDRKMCENHPGKFSNHQQSDKDGEWHYYCCECYVRMGNAPADWHKGCMEEYGRIKSETSR